MTTSPSVGGILLRVVARHSHHHGSITLAIVAVTVLAVTIGVVYVIACGNSKLDAALRDLPPEPDQADSARRGE